MHFDKIIYLKIKTTVCLSIGMIHDMPRNWNAIFGNLKILENPVSNSENIPVSEIQILFYACLKSDSLR